MTIIVIETQGIQEIYYIDIESCENVDKYILFHVKHYELLLLITPIARRIYGLYAFLICIFIYRRKNVAVGRYVVNQVYMSGFMLRKFRFGAYFIISNRTRQL